MCDVHLLTHDQYVTWKTMALPHLWKSMSEAFSLVMSYCTKLFLCNNIKVATIWWYKCGKQPDSVALSSQWQISSVSHRQLYCMRKDCKPLYAISLCDLYLWERLLIHHLYYRPNLVSRKSTSCRLGAEDAEKLIIPLTRPQTLTSVRKRDLKTVRETVLTWKSQESHPKDKQSKTSSEFVLGPNLFLIQIHSQRKHKPNIITECSYKLVSTHPNC